MTTFDQRTAHRRTRAAQINTLLWFRSRCMDCFLTIARGRLAPPITRPTARVRHTEVRMVRIVYCVYVASLVSVLVLGSRPIQLIAAAVFLAGAIPLARWGYRTFFSQVLTDAASYLEGLQRADATSPQPDQVHQGLRLIEFQPHQPEQGQPQQPKREQRSGHAPPSQSHRQ